MRGWPHGLSWGLLSGEQLKLLSWDRAQLLSVVLHVGSAGHSPPTGMWAREREKERFLSCTPPEDTSWLLNFYHEHNNSLFSRIPLAAPATSSDQKIQDLWRAECWFISSSVQVLASPYDGDGDAIPQSAKRHPQDASVEKCHNMLILL